MASYQACQLASLATKRFTKEGTSRKWILGVGQKNIQRQKMESAHYEHIGLLNYHQVMFQTVDCKNSMCIFFSRIMCTVLVALSQTSTHTSCWPLLSECANIVTPTTSNAQKSEKASNDCFLSWDALSFQQNNTYYYNRYLVFIPGNKMALMHFALWYDLGGSVTNQRRISENIIARAARCHTDMRASGSRLFLGDKKLFYTLQTIWHSDNPQL